MNIIDRLTAAGRVLVGQIPDGLMIAGACAVAYGVGQIYPPAGWIVGGLLLLAGGWLLARGGN